MRGRFVHPWLARHGVDEGARILHSLLDLIADGRLKPPAAQRYRFDDGAQAFTAAEGTGLDAKPLLSFSQDGD